MHNCIRYNCIKFGVKCSTRSLSNGQNAHGLTCKTRYHSGTKSRIGMHLGPRALDNKLSKIRSKNPKVVSYKKNFNKKMRNQKAKTFKKMLRRCAASKACDAIFLKK